MQVEQVHGLRHAFSVSWPVLHVYPVRSGVPGARQLLVHGLLSGSPSEGSRQLACIVFPGVLFVSNEAHCLSVCSESRRFALASEPWHAAGPFTPYVWLHLPRHIMQVPLDAHYMRRLIWPQALQPADQTRRLCLPPC